MSVLRLVQRLVGPESGFVCPGDPRRAHASGPAPYRVLLVGAQALVGAGVATNELALPGTVARSVAGLTAHGVDVDGVALADMGARRIERGVSGVGLERYDAVVLVLDWRSDSWRQSQVDLRLRAVLDCLRARMRPAGVLVVAVAGIGTDVALVCRGFGGFCDEVQNAAGPVASVVRLGVALGGERPAAETYAMWGLRIATELGAQLVDPVVWEDPVDSVDESRRLIALRGVARLDEELERVLRRIVLFAGDAYGTKYAAICLIGDTDARYVSRKRGVSPVVPRKATICDIALPMYGGLIVGDATNDVRVRSVGREVAGGIGFYAGYRIEYRGQPVGVLAVWDPEPRPVLHQDLVVLRDFALAAERKFWEHSPDRAESFDLPAMPRIDAALVVSAGRAWT